MEKLIITVAGDSRTSYPHNNLCPAQEDIAGCAQQYVDAVKAGAAISHIHGRRTLEESIQADGKMVSRIHHSDWKKLHHMITEKVDTIMQYGVASARIEEKIELMKLGPDMMAVAFNAHDEYFQPVPTLPPKRMMAIHPVEELIAYAKAAEEHKVKLECECFQTGAFWHLEFVRRAGYLKKQTYVTLFIGWPGGTWMPPTERALQFFVDNLPPDTIWNVSVMNPEKLMVHPRAGRRARRSCAGRLRGQPLHRAGRVRQEQRRAGRSHGRHRAAPGPGSGDTGRGSENPGTAAVAVVKPMDRSMRMHASPPLPRERSGGGEGSQVGAAGMQRTSPHPGELRSPTLPTASRGDGDAAPPYHADPQARQIRHRGFRRRPRLQQFRRPHRSRCHESRGSSRA